MSGTFPTYPAPSSIVIASTSPTLVSSMQNLSRQVRSRGGQRWGFELAWQVATREDIAAVVGFVAAQRGQYETFSYAPLCWYRQGVTGGTPLVAGGSQTGLTVDLDGFPADTLAIKAGDFIQFDGSTKVYMAKSDATSNGAGELTVTLNTPLITSPADNAAVSFHERGAPLLFNVALADDDFAMPGEFDTVYELALRLTEVA